MTILELFTDAILIILLGWLVLFLTALIKLLTSMPKKKQLDFSYTIISSSFCGVTLFFIVFILSKLSVLGS